MTGHCDADTLAEFRAGLLPGRRRRAIAAHLLSCAQCAALDARLAQVSALLAAAPVAAMPDSVIRRLDAVLAAEAENFTHAESSAVKHSRRRWKLAGADAGSRFPLYGKVAAAAAVVLAAAGFGLSQLVQGSPATPTAVSAGAAANRTTRPPSFGKSLTPHNAEEGPVSGGGPADGAFSVVISGIDYQPATLAQQLQSQVAQRSGLRAIPAPVSLAACVIRVADGSTPILVESARYRGSAATIVVVPHGSGYLGRVAGTDCSATDSDVIATAVLSPGISAP